MSNKKKELDRTYPATSAYYAVANRCWSKKSRNGYYSPIGELFKAPSGLTRFNGSWWSRSVEGDLVIFTDRAYGNYRLSHKAAFDHHLRMNPSLRPLCRRRESEKSCKTTTTGVPGLYIYPPKNRDLPLNKANRWKIFAKAGNMKLKLFYTRPHLAPGDVEFDKQYLAASIYCEQGRKEYIEKNKFVK